MISRRRFLEAGLGALAGPILSGCSSPSAPTVSRTAPRFTARPGSPSTEPTLGLDELGLGLFRDGLLYVPESYDPAARMPLVVALHGAGGSGSSWGSYPGRAETLGFVFLAPDSRSHTWDLRGEGPGTDSDFIDRALAHVFERCRIDPDRIVLAGFSDGASWGLTVGVSNGDLFTHLVGYSPGYFAPSSPIVGQPRVFVSHGTSDTVLPVGRSREIVALFEEEGYDVTYREFGGGHEVPSEISDQALSWFLAPTPP